MKYAIALLLFCSAVGIFVLSRPTTVPSAGCPTDSHYSYFSTRPFFEEAYANASTSTASFHVYGITVNHHLLAASLIAETINTIATTVPVTVLLVSPNHFAVGEGSVISSIYQWQTPYGILESDCEAIKKLAGMGAVSIEEGPFVKEHGISGIMPFIKKSLPNAKVVPIILKDTTLQPTLGRLVDELYKEFGNEVVVIGSFDFSHYVTPEVARAQDKKSIAALESFDFEALQFINIDSVPGVEIVLRYMQKVGATRFSLLVNSNAAEILKRPDLADTTSYINGIFLKP